MRKVEAHFCYKKAIIQFLLIYHLDLRGEILVEDCERIAYNHEIICQNNLVSHNYGLVTYLI